jgi:gliding motility-associated-like protein
VLLLCDLVQQLQIPAITILYFNQKILAMKRIYLLLFIIFPVFLFSQITEDLQNETKNTEGEVTIQKSDLIGLDVNQLIDLGFGNIENINPSHPQSQIGGERVECFDPYIPVDPNTYTAVPRNDDGSLYISNLGFSFSFCGTSYTDCYINTNGNISFGSAVAQYSPDGFPFGTPMVAPFWADVDTRNTSCGQIWYQIFPNYMIVSWEEVGWYNQNCNPVNTFQCIISDGTASIIGVGNNIQFRYGDMEWTTGTASGGGPFGGFPATVGYNSGDNVNFEQVGRFNVNDSSYDGPFGANDGVHWLDFKCFVFNSGTGSFTLDCIDITRSLDANCEVNITAEDVSEALASGCSAVDVSLDISSFGCNDLGFNTVTITATSGNETETCTAIVEILEGSCNATSIEEPAPICAEGSPITLTANPPGGTWGPSAPGGVFDPSISGPGIHEVTYNTPLGCPPTASIFITVNESPLVSILPSPAEFCENDGFVELMANGSGGDGNYSYNWTTPFGGQFGQSILANAGGLYTVTISDGFGCSSEASTNVTVNPNPFVDINYQDPICNSEAVVQLTGTPAGGIWTGNGITQDGFIFPGSMSPGFSQFTYTYTNNFGCEGSAMIDVEILITPDALAFNNGPYCEGQAIELFGNTNSPGFPTYLWTGPNGYTSDQQNPIDATEPGAYVLETTLNGCTSEPASTIVNVTAAPVAIAVNDGPICEGQAFTLIGAANPIGNTNEYQWEGPNGYTSNEANPLDATEDGIYTLIVTVDGCPSEPTTTLVEFSAPPVAVAENTGPYCVGDFIILSGSTPAQGTVITYNWTGPNNYSSGDQNPIDATEPGTYTLEVNVDGCLSDLENTEVIINLPPEPAITGDNTFCEGSSSTLDAGTGYVSYVWSDSSVGQTLDVTTNGTYSVTVTDANGCTGEDDFNITTNPNPNPTIAGSTSFCTGFSTILDAGVYNSYLWSDTSTDQTLEVSVGGTYSVTVTNANGCTGVASLDVIESSSLNPNISGDLDYCVGNSTTLNVGAGYVLYEWSDGSGGQSIIVDTPDDYSVTVTDANGCSGETTVSVIENQLPTPSITGNNPICNGESLTLDAGTGFENYEWSNTSLNQIIQVSSSGPYTVTVTDANGCTNEASVDVQVNPNPTPTITGDQSFCDGETVTLDAGTYDQYQWSDASTLSTLNITIGGPYAVTVTDNNGCTGVDQFTATLNQLPTATITGDLEFCEGSSTSLNGPNGFDYNWSNGDTSQIVNIDIEGSIGLTITDTNGCIGETSVDLIENPNPNPTITGSTTFCIGNSTIIDAGGGYDLYEWSNGTFDQSLQVTAEGNYSVTVTDTNGCTGVTQTFVTESLSLEPVIIGDANICEGETSTLDAGAGFATYLWSNGEITQTIIADSTNNYTVTVSDSQGCTGENTFSLIINQNPTATISGIEVLCEGEISTLDAGTGFSTYLWSNGENTQTIDVDSSDVFAVTVTDSNGCSDETQINITVNPNPTPTISGQSSFCEGNNATLDAGIGYDTYLWSTGDTTQTITVVDGNLYSVTVTTPEGCTGETSLDVIENSSLTPVILGDLNFCDGDNSILDAGSGYQTYEWSNGEITQTITVTQNGNYEVLVTDSDGCSGTANVNVSTFQNPSPIIAGSTTFCTGSSTTLDAGNYSTYLWSNGDTTQTIVVDVPNTYTVDVTDQNGCAGTASIVVTESSSLSPVISGFPAFCTGETTILNAGAGFTTYLWSDGTTNQTLEVGTANDYSVTVSDASGCTGEATISIIENMPPVAELVTGPILCNTDAGGSITNLYDLIISGDNTGTWTDTDNSGALGLFDNLNFNGIPPGDYTFTYTTNSAIAPCQEASYPVVVTILDCACPSVSFNAVDPLCNSNGTLDLSTIINTSEVGTWTIISAPVGTSPASVNGQIFDAISADAGGYDLQFELTNTPPPGCDELFNVSVSVENEVFAGTAAMPMDFCADEVQIVPLNDLLNGEEPNGVWTETSGVSSQNGAFDPATGSFNMTGQNSGIYTFEYTISPGGACPDDSETVTVIVNEVPTAVAGSTIELNCLNPTLSLNAFGSSNGPDFDIQWSGGVVLDGNENTISPTVNQAGIYTLTITNTQTGCIATDQVQVTQSDDVPNSFAGNDDELTCIETEVTLVAGGNIGNGFEILWQGPAITSANMNDLNPVVNLSGEYILIITNTDNGCVSSPDTVIIIDNNVDPEVVIETPLSIDCNNPEVAIIGNASISGATLEWFSGNISIGNGSAINGIDAPGFYTLVATDNQTGCTGSETIEVFQDINPPLADAGSPQLINCYDPEVTLDGSGSENGTEFSYTWSGPGVTGIPTNVDVTVNQAGEYTLSVYNNINGCESFSTVLVEENTTPPIAVILQPDQFDCTINEVTLDGSGSSSGANFNYTWLDEQGGFISNDINIDVQSIGSYFLTVQDTDNGCETTTSIIVSEDMDVPNSVAFQINNPDCFGDNDGNISVTEVFGGMPPYVFSINDQPFSTNAFYTGLTPGVYDISLQDANGCEWDTTINILEPAEVNINLGIDLQLEMGDSAIVKAQINIPNENIDTIIWSPASLINCGDPECLEIGFSSFYSQNLTATLVDIYGCTDEDDISVFIDRDRRVFIPNAFSPNGDGNNDLFMIFGDDKHVININKFIVFNRWGEVVYQGLNFKPNDPDFGWDGTLRGEVMNPAVFVYLAEIEFLDGEVVLYKGDVTLVR